LNFRRKIDNHCVIRGKSKDDFWESVLCQGLTPSFRAVHLRAGGSSSFFDRVTSSVTGKCNKYKEILAANSLRFVVAAYLDFLTGMTLDDCREDSEMFRSVFDANDSLWVILFFTETQFIGGKQRYGFFCLCADSPVTAIPNWPFQTMNLNQ